MTRPAIPGPDPDADAVDHPGKTPGYGNISTEHQEEGDAGLPSDTLDRDQAPPADDGGRKSSFLHDD